MCVCGGGGVGHNDPLPTALPFTVLEVVDPSEEVRLQLLKLVSGLVEGLLQRGGSQILHPYFHDAILFLQASFRTHIWVACTGLYGGGTGMPFV